jgi:hypothetical protein
MEASPAVVFAIEWRLVDGAWSAWRAKLERDYNEHPDWGWEWARLVGVRTLLEGGVQFRTDGGVLFPPDLMIREHEETQRWQEEHGEFVDPPLNEAERFGWTLPLVHLADWLAWLIGDGAFLDAPDGTELAYRAPEVNFYITFGKHDGRVLFTSSWAHSPVLETTIDDLVTGIRRFVSQLVQEIKRHAPELLEWEVVEALASFTRPTSKR